MKKYVMLCALFCFTMVCSAQTTYSKETAEKIREVENNIQRGAFRIEGMPNATIPERMAHHHVKGLSIAVVYNYEIVWAKGYGWADSAEQRPVTPETLFEPGSISKSLNALGVLKLVQDKKLDLDADINTCLSSWKFPYDSVSKNKKITTRHLLSHTAGLSVHGFPGYFRGDKFPTIPQILDGAKPANTPAVRSLFEPGLKFKYSGGGTMISELIQMDLTKLPYDRYIKETVFDPIGMNNSFFTQPPPAGLETRLATGYSGNGKALAKKYPVLIEQAAGGLWTTPTDLCKFIVEMQLSLQGKSNKVLDQSMAIKMMTPYIDQSSALGVFIEDVNGTKYFSHSAGNQGFSGQYCGSLEGGNGIAVVLNSDNGGSLLQEIISSVAEAYHWKGFDKTEKPAMKKVVSVPDSVLKKYIGVYRQNTYVTTISLLNGELVYTATEPWKMYFISPTEFFNLEVGTEKTFRFNSKGEVTGFTKTQAGKEVGTTVKTTTVSPSETQLKKYAGTYDDHGQKFSIVKKGKALWIEDGGYDEPQKLVFLSETEFFMPSDFGSVNEFVVNAKGKVEKLIAKAGEETKAFTKLK
jgi:CubicO group peptidase (beta-lactamase class C family)